MLWWKDGRQREAEALAGNRGTPTLKQHPQEPVLRAEPLQVPLSQGKLFSMGKEAGAAARGGRAGRVHGRPRGFAQAACEESSSLAGAWQERDRGWGWRSSLLPALLGNENMRSFTQKLHYGVVGFFFLRLFLSALLWRKTILRRGGPFSNYH